MYKTMLNNEIAGGQNPAQIFAALGDPTRLMLLQKLGDGKPQSINKLTADFHLTRQAITKHLHVLEEVGIVTSKKTGREKQFCFEPKAIEQAQDYLSKVGEQWDDALYRLKSYVEE